MHDSNPTTQDVRTPLLQHQHGTSPVGRPPVSRPKNKRRRSSFDASTYNSTGQSPGYLRSASSSLHDSNGLQPVEHVAPGLTLYQMLSLTVCMAGVQFTWTVELSYGTPYLLSLNLSKELTALVWLAGPLSGLLVQPLIGAFSDKCTSRFGKRRPFIIVAGFLTCLSMLGVAYAREIAHGVAGLLATETDEIERLSRTYAIVVAVASFYFLDFTLNAVQAICRALILDIPPLWQQDYANAWGARMSNSAMVIGYFVGFIDLVKYVPWLGDAQIKVFCVIAITVFCLTLGITCMTTHEKKLDEELDVQPWYSTFVYIWRAFRYLPKPVQTLCNTQFFAWMGWFPFLFYSTQWVSDLYFANNPTSNTTPNWADGTRAGSFALLCYSVVSVLAGLIIPAISTRFEKSHGWLSLTNVYTASHLIVAGTLLSAWFVDSVAAATILLAIMGIPWAIVLWVPFSLVGEFVSYEDDRRQQQSVTSAPTGTSSSSPAYLESQQDDFDAGMILGVHNMYIVFPQFAVAVISAFIFAAADAAVGDKPDGKNEASSVASVLAFGGLMALVAAGFSRFIVRVKQQ